MRWSCGSLGHGAELALEKMSGGKAALSRLWWKHGTLRCLGARSRLIPDSAPLRVPATASLRFLTPNSDLVEGQPPTQSGLSDLPIAGVRNFCRTTHSHRRLQTISDVTLPPALGSAFPGQGVEIRLMGRSAWELLSPKSLSVRAGGQNCG